MSNNITSGSNLIVSNNTTIGNNLYVSGASTLGTISSSNATISSLTNTNATINTLIVNNVDVNGSLKVLGVDLIEYLDNNSTTSNISYDPLLNKTTIVGNTYIQTLTAGTVDTNTLKLNGIDVINSLTTGYTNYVNEKISDLIGGAPESLNTLKEIADLMNSDPSLSQSLVSSISGINSSINTLSNNVNLLQVNDANQSSVNTSVNNSLLSLNTIVTGIDSKQLLNTSNISTNTNNIATLRNDVNNVETKTNSLETKTNSLETETNSNTNSINLLNTQINNNSNSISSISNSLNNLDSKLTSTQTDLTNLQIDVASFEIMATKTAINDLQTAHTGITYNIVNDVTTVDNNVTISSGKNLVLGSTNVMNSLIAVSDTLTGLSYNTVGDVTTIDNNVTITSGKNLIVGTTNVLNNLLTLNDTVSGISYNTTGDLTTIDNNLTITSGKNLLLGTTNVLNTLNAINQTLSGISYNTTGDLTTINNHIIMPVGNNLLFGDTYNVKSKIDEKALIIGNNNFDGTNKFQSDTIPLQITTKNNPSLNNSLSFVFATGNGQLNPLVKTDDLVLYSGLSIDNAKSNIYIGPWSSLRKGIRISSSKLEVGTGVIDTNGYILDGSSSNSVCTLTPSGLNGGFEVFTTNSVNSSLKNKRLMINDGGTHTYGYTSLNNDNLQVLPGNIVANKNINLKKTALVLINHLDTYGLIYQNNEVMVLDNGSINDSKVNITVRGPSPGNDTNGNPIDGPAKNVMNISHNNTTINNDLIISGSLTSTTLTTFPNITDLTISNSQTAGTSSGSAHSSRVASVTLNKPLKKQIKFTSPISFYRSVLSALTPTTTTIADKEIKTTISNINIQVRKNGIIEPATNSSFLFNDKIPRVITAYKATYVVPTTTAYNLNFYIGTINITHDINGNAGDVFTYHITANIETVTKNESNITEYLFSNTTTQTVSHSSFLSVTQDFSQEYYSPSYSLSVTKANFPLTGLLQSNEISANDIGTNNLNVNTGNFNSIINKGNLTSNYIKSPSNIAGYMFNGNIFTATPHTPTPIICSMKYFAHANVDDVYVINPGYKVLLFKGVDYNTWDPSNPNSQLSAYSSHYWEIINDSDTPKVVETSSENRNNTESIVVYYRPSIEEPYSLVWYPYLSYIPT
jgi:hypothetical protein